jgi:DNA primase
VLVLPDGTDPDEFVRAHGVEEYNKRRGAAVPHIQFVLEQAVASRNIHNPPEKSEAVTEVLPFLRAIRNPIQKREYFDMMMDALRVEDPSLRQDLWKIVSAREAVDTTNIKQKVTLAEALKLTDAERRLLVLLLHDEELRQIVLPNIEESDYEELPTAPIFLALKEATSKGDKVTFDSISEHLDDNQVIKDLLAKLWIDEPQRVEGEATDDFVTASMSCLLAIRYTRADEHIKRLNVSLRRASVDNLEELNRLQAEQWEWTQYQRELKNSFLSLGIDPSLAFGIH